ncbi:MAG: efflux RND transporter periplasmic adaptor subunit [Bdellovibrionales bacterium]|nr:efflux RND transporter periplasmic adaptor subunit [Bdellovibrionales bacterium]
MKRIFLLLTVLVSFQLIAEDEEGGGAKDRVGPGKAVIAADKDKGIKLSEKALKTLDLAFVQVQNPHLSVPRSAMVYFQDFSAIYRLRDGWFRMVEVEPSINGEQATFSSKDLKQGDQVVVRNGSLLRVVELDVFGPEADACAD